MGILSDVKVILNVSPESTYFDNELLLHINALAMNAYQLGFAIKPPENIITDTTDWADIFDSRIIQSAKQWLGLKARMIWDPPQGSARDSVQATIDEIEWRMVEQLDISVLQSGEQQK